MSDAIAPVVVDSPIETPVASSSPTVESLLEPRPAEPSHIEQTPQQQQQQNDTTAAQAAQNTADQIKQLGEMVGRDLSRFKDVESAQAAADMIVESWATSGDNDLLSSLQPDKPTGNQPAAAVESDDLGLDETTVDPAVIAVLKKMKGENADLRNKFAESQKAQSAQQAQAVAQQLEQRAEGFLDKLDSDMFGKAGKRNIAQNAAASVVGQVAGKMLMGAIAEARRTGRTNIPTIEKIMEVALKQTGFAAMKKADAVVVSKPHTLAPKSGSSGVTSPGRIRVSPANDPNGFFGPDADPKITAIWREALGI